MLIKITLIHSISCSSIFNIFETIFSSHRRSLKLHLYIVSLVHRYPIPPETFPFHMVTYRNYFFERPFVEPESLHLRLNYTECTLSSSFLPFDPRITVYLSFTVRLPAPGSLLLSPVPFILYSLASISYFFHPIPLPPLVFSPALAPSLARLPLLLLRLLPPVDSEGFRSPSTTTVQLLRGLLALSRANGALYYRSPACSALRPRWMRLNRRPLMH